MKATNFHAAAFFAEPRITTRLEPPANDTPALSGPGNGAVAHAPCSESGRRFRNSPTFQGPVMYIATRPAANSLVRLTLLMHPAGRVHLTSGILPRKYLQLAHDWVQPGLAVMAPSARMG